MKIFNVKFVREFEVEIQAEDTKTAETLAQKVLGQFAAGTCKLLSIVDVENVPLQAEPPPTPRRPRGGPPNLGGSPATPTIKVPVLVDQVAEAA